MKPRHELSEIVHLYGSDFLKQHPQKRQEIKTLDALAGCRTASLGGHKCKCKSCGHEKYFYNSCRNRHCPKCQAVNRERWIMQREAELLPVAYYHIVFTLPHELNETAKQYPKQAYNALFNAGWDTINTLSQDKRYMGAKTGMVAILHTWGQKLWLHPHLHCIVPGGGITGEGKWKNARHRGKYLFPQKAMSKMYRAKFVAELRASGVVITQDAGKAIFSKDWVVYAKRPFAGPEAVVEYLGRYTHKIAISNHRLISIVGNEIHFTYKDYRKEAQKLQTKLPAVEFLRRFCRHILPKGFVRMRHYGILASKNKAKELNIAKMDLGLSPWKRLSIDWKTIVLEKFKADVTKCPKCRTGIMELTEVIMPERGPPVFKMTSDLKFLQS